MYLHNSYGKETARRDILADGWMDQRTVGWMEAI